MSHDFLIELGCEELPAKQLRSLIQSFATELTKQCHEFSLDHDDVIVYCTPRRLAILIKQLVDQQAPQRIERRGPSMESAFDESGTPTLACLGFARSCKTSVDELAVQKTKKGSWLYFEGETPGQASVDLLPKIISKALSAVHINKPMRWGAEPHRFLRPVQWAVVLFGSDIVPVSLFGVTSSNTTYGHRFHHPGPIHIDEPSQYATLLREKGKVIASWKKRRELIARALNDTAAPLGRVVMDESLLDEVASLVEWPVVLSGEFTPAFLDMPRDVLITTMQSHQKCFAIENSKGELVPSFLLVSNIQSSDPNTVIKGNERVIHARLSDAHFFYQQDLKTPLKDRTDALAGVIFTPKTGSMADKTTRVTAIASAFAKYVEADKNFVKKASELCKCDLLTEMVGEFPSLQGIMGYHYASAQGVDPIIANALKDYYLPKSAHDSLPEDPTSVCLALADRLDTLVGILGTEGKPKGDKDPFGLRRQALGVVRILIHNTLKQSMTNLLKPVLKAYQDTVPKECVDLVWTFIADRFKAWALEQGFTPQQFEAITATGSQDIADAYIRLSALRDFLQDPRSESLASAHKRVANILKKHSGKIPKAIDKKQLVMAEEVELVKSVSSIEETVNLAVKESRYTDAFTALATLKEPVDAFFNDVLIMADDPALQKNRLAIVNTLAQLLSSVAELSYL